MELDPLQELLNSCRRNGRPARFQRKPEPIFFDAERFRWWFKRGCRIPGLQEELLRRLSNGAQINNIRRWMDGQIKLHCDVPAKETVLL